MKVSEAQKKASNKWEKKQYRLLIRIDKEKQEKIKEIAASNNESINEMINRLIDQEITK